MENYIKRKILKTYKLYKVCLKLKKKDCFESKELNNILYEGIFESFILNLYSLLNFNEKYSIKDCFSKDEQKFFKWEVYSILSEEIKEKNLKFKKIFSYIKTWRDKKVAHKDIWYENYYWSLHTADIKFIFKFLEKKYSLASEFKEYDNLY